MPKLHQIVFIMITTPDEIVLIKTVSPNGLLGQIWDQFVNFWCEND